MRKTKNWKHTSKRNKQYKEYDMACGYFNPYYDPMSYVGKSKKETPFMDLSDMEEEED